MMIRALFVALALAAGALPGAPPAAAETAPGLPQQPLIDRLFQQLKTAKDEPEARSLQAQIERLWSRSGSDTADLLLQRVDVAIKLGQQDTALDLLDSLLALQPGWAEAWNRRATLNFLRKDYDASMRDIARVLALEPRHYAAWSGLGIILMQVNEKKQALAAFEKALAIDPKLESARNAADRLKKELDGSDI